MQTLSPGPWIRRLAVASALGLAACAAPSSGPAPAPEAAAADVPVQRFPSIRPADHNDLSAPLTLLPPAERSGELVEHEVKPVPRPAASRDADLMKLPDPVHQSRFLTALAMPSTLTNFDGVGQGFSGPAGTFSVNSAPPDTNGDVGPNHYVQVVNTDLAVFSKTGTVLLGPVPINTLWSGFGGLCQTDNDGDPVVLYDPIADRWVVSQFAVTGANPNFFQCVAVSQTPDPTGAWYRYSFSYTGFPDYPKMGVWPDAYYQTYNMFNAAGTSFLGGKVCAFDRSKMLLGQAATQQCFDVGTSFGGLLPADLDGARLPPAGSPGYVLALGAAANQLAFWKFHVDWTTPASSTLAGPTTIATAAFTEACSGGTCIPQSGTTKKLDSLADRLMFRLAYRNFGDHESLVTNHSVTAGTSTGVRWYELRLSNGTPSLFQQGTYAPDSNYRWMGSIAQDQSGNLALGFSLSGAALHPEIHYTGRLAGDAAGQMTQGEGTIIDGAGSQFKSGSTLSRWGDYSMMAIDPVDDCTFWFTTEYIPSNGTFNWKTRIGSFKFPGCGATAQNDFSIGASPATLSLVRGTGGTSTVSTSVTSGSAAAVSLAVSGVPSGATATLSPTSVTAGGSSTLTVNTGTAAPGSYTLTVTGTEGSAVHSATVSLTVIAPNDFSIAASPATLPALVQGTSGSSTISTAVTSGSAATVGLSVSSAPAGLATTLAPASVTAGGSAALTIDSTGAAPGSYTVTVSGTEGSFQHSTTVAVTVVAPNDFSLAASPGTLPTLVQGAAGSSTISTAVTSGSAAAVSLSVSSAPAGLGASLSPASVVAGGSATLTVDTSGAAPGSYTVTVTGTEGGFVHSVGVGVTVVAPNDFSLAAAPAALSLVQGTSGDSAISTALASGSAEQLALSVAGVPSGATAGFSASPILAGSGSTLTVNAGSAAPGTYPLTVTATGATATHSVAVSLTVTAPIPDDFSITATPASLVLAQGASGQSSIQTAVTTGAAEQLALTVSGAPGGLAASLDQIAFPAGGQATLTVDASAAAPGDYLITVTATSASAAHAVTVAVHVPAPIPNDFSIAATPASLQLVQGTSGQSTIQTAVTSGSAESLTLQLGGVTGGLTASLDTSGFLAGGQAVLTVGTSGAAPGSYTLTVAATGASAAHSVSVAVTVSAPVLNDFSVAATPASLSLAQGTAGTSVIGTALLTGSAETLALSASVPAGASASFSTGNVTTGGSATLTVNAGSAAPGSYTVTVTASGASFSHSVAIALTVVAPDDFSVSATPGSLTLTAGSAGSVGVLTATTSGSAQPVSLSVSGAPSGVTASVSPGSVTSGSSATLSVSSTSAAVAGTYTLTVTGTAASGVHSASVGLTITAAGNQLANNVPVTGLAGTTGTQQGFTINVPAGQGVLNFTLSGGTGDADLYVRFGAAPTTSTYDCRPFVSGNSESCSFSNPAAGTWYVMLNAYATYSGVSLVASYGPDTTPALVNGQAVTGISGATGSQQYWKLSVPAGKATLTFKTSGGTGDADLYVKRGAKPTTTTYDCRPFVSGNTETCTFTNPVAADYYVMLRGYAAYTGVSLTGAYQ